MSLAADLPGPTPFWRRRSTHDAGLAALFLAPSMVVFGAFFFYPIGRIVYLGLFQQNQTRTKQRYVGPEQYRDVLTGHEFIEGLTITLKYVALTVPAGLVLGVLLAVAANRRLRGIKIFQTILSSTVATSVAVASNRVTSELMPPSAQARTLLRT